MSADRHPAGRPTADEEWRATGDVAAMGLHAIVAMAADTQAAVSRRVTVHLPAAAVPVMATERIIASAVYGIIGAAHRVAPRAAARLAAAVTPPSAPPSTSRVGAAAQAASNALWGDRVEAEHAALAIPMAVRVAGTDLPLRGPTVAAAFPRATPHVVVMVHGLVGDERWWHLRTRSGTGSYGDRLLRDHDLTPVVVRYNSGRHISDNGRDLSALLEDLVAAWPVPVASVSLVGHSMGGLVARSACHVGAESGADWTARTRVLVSLGTPHLGAPLERAAHVTDRALRLLPETEPFSRPLASRSAGIKDLRYGALVEEDWAGYDPDEFLRNRCTQVPLLPHVTYYWVSSTLTHDPTHPVGRLLGDGLVLPASANGAHVGLDEASGIHVGAASHLHLMNHPEVYQQLADWLEPPRAP
jgi:pimeloyl-ACP methyl ester carboxylesterase